MIGAWKIMWLTYRAGTAGSGQEKPTDLYFAANQAKKAANLILDASPRIKEKLRPQIEEPEERSIEACRETTREPSTTR